MWAAWSFVALRDDNSNYPVAEDAWCLKWYIGCGILWPFTALCNGWRRGCLALANAWEKTGFCASFSLCFFLDRRHSTLPQSLESVVNFLKFTEHKPTPNRNFLVRFLEHRPQSIYKASTIHAFPTSCIAVLGFYQTLLLCLVSGSWR